MGNETSSVKIHSDLSADDIRGLRATFPGGGNGVPPTDLNWGLWGSAWSQDDRLKIEKMMKPVINNNTGAESKALLTFHSYQELAGTVVRGAPDHRVKFVFKMMDAAPEKTVKSAEFREFAIRIAITASRIGRQQNLGAEDEAKDEKSAAAFVDGIVMHDLVYTNGETKKAVVDEGIPGDVYLDFDMIERWLVMKCPIFEDLMLYVLGNSFGISPKLNTSSPPMIPRDGISFSPETTLLTPSEVIFLNNEIPPEFRSKWRLLFNSRIHGESFSKLAAGILKRGPTLVIIHEKNGKKFGGFAGDSWNLGPKFYGPNSSFLFNLTPKMLAYESTRFNTNYQYINLKQKTMPNGLGMGGQLEFFGLWLDSEYGEGKCAPSCSSFASPRLSKQENFHFDHLEVWGVGDEPEVDSDEEGGKSALDLDPEAQAVMEMMGKTFVSKTVKAVDEQNEKERKDQETKKKLEEGEKQ